MGETGKQDESDPADVTPVRPPRLGRDRTGQRRPGRRADRRAARKREAGSRRRAGPGLRNLSVPARTRLTERAGDEPGQHGSSSRKEHSNDDLHPRGRLQGQRHQQHEDERADHGCCPDETAHGPAHLRWQLVFFSPPGHRSPRPLPFTHRAVVLSSSYDERGLHQGRPHRRPRSSQAGHENDAREPG